MGSFVNIGLFLYFAPTPFRHMRTSSDCLGHHLAAKESTFLKFCHRLASEQERCISLSSYNFESYQNEAALNAYYGHQILPDLLDICLYVKKDMMSHFFLNFDFVPKLIEHILLMNEMSMKIGKILEENGILCMFFQLFPGHFSSC